MNDQSITDNRRAWKDRVVRREATRFMYLMRARNIAMKAYWAAESPESENFAKRILDELDKAVEQE